jgi:hypothetical protein
VEVFTGEKSRSAREDVLRRDIGVGGIGTERGCCLRDGKEALELWTGWLRCGRVAGAVDNVGRRHRLAQPRLRGRGDG